MKFNNSNMKSLKDKLAEEVYGEFGFDTLSYEQQQMIFSGNPNLKRSPDDKGADFSQQRFNK